MGVGNMYDKDDIMSMVGLAETLIDKYSKEDAMKILKNLEEWIKHDGDTYAYNLNTIALAFKGEKLPISSDYDVKVNKELIGLYSQSARTGNYAVGLLEAGLEAKRGYDILNDLTRVKKNDNEVYITAYVSDSSWSDKWIKQMIFCAGYMHQLRRHGCDIMEIFTPKHNPNTFYEICYSIVAGRGDENYNVPLQWLKDYHWRPYMAKYVWYLYRDAPGREWGEIVQPWMPKLALDEISESKKSESLDCNAIIEKWKNVSPKLEHALESYFEHEGLSAEKMYEEYDYYRRQYCCDGDALAEQIFKDNYPDWVGGHNDYYHECVVSWKGIQDSASASSMTNVVSGAFNAAAIMGGD